MPQIYKAVHKMTLETKYGYFSELCDLDKRLWNLTLTYHSDSNGEPEVTPLAIIQIKVPMFNIDKPTVYLLKTIPINSSQDFVGLYVGD